MLRRTLTSVSAFLLLLGSLSWYSSVLPSTRSPETSSPNDCDLNYLDFSEDRIEITRSLRGDLSIKLHPTPGGGLSGRFESSLTRIPSTSEIVRQMTYCSKAKYVDYCGIYQERRSRLSTWDTYFSGAARRLKGELEQEYSRAVQRCVREFLNPVIADRDRPELVSPAPVGEARPPVAPTEPNSPRRQDCSTPPQVRFYTEYLEIDYPCLQYRHLNLKFRDHTDRYSSFRDRAISNSLYPIRLEAERFRGIPLRNLELRILGAPKDPQDAEVRLATARAGN